MESSKEVRTMIMQRTAYNLQAKPQVGANIRLGIDGELLGKAFQISFPYILTL